MKTKVVNGLIPLYVKEFSCIGSSCEDTCCSGWKVPIDNTAYKKYNNVKDKELKTKIKENITRNRNNPTKDYMASFIMGSKGCSLQDEKGLCEIHSKLGESFLCNTCAVYPRVNNLVNGVTEQTLTVSCPEAARLVLLNKNGIEFEQTKLEMKRDVYVYVARTNKEEIKDWTDLFDEYRYVTILILQHRQYSLEERLLLLGLMYNEIDENVKSGNLNNIPTVLGEYLEALDKKDLKEALKTVNHRKDIQLRICRELLLVRMSSGIYADRYIECLREMSEGLNISKTTTDDEVLESYESAYELYYKPFMVENEYLLENYLVNYVFKNCMPIEEKNPFDSYSKMVLHYALLKIHLIGMSNFHKGLSSELVVKLVQSLSKTYEHSTFFLDEIKKSLQDGNMMNLTYMSILINN
ncbi:flagellin lysine-N-methylase [Peribacillus sp. NPDC097295]|uniref:flagellin lysine-N-methylase n=1 Tax=Peribacillus sp. NPDC097295 TaxID=3364402 RepID=UPI003825A417